MNLSLVTVLHVSFASYELNIHKMSFDDKCFLGPLNIPAAEFFMQAEHNDAQQTDVA